MEATSAMANGTILELHGLTVAYGFKRAVENLSLTLTKGQSLGLVGENGAGKTSTLRALLGMIRPRAGSVTVFGRRAGTREVFRRIGFAPEDGEPPEFLTAEEYLRFLGSF